MRDHAPNEEFHQGQEEMLGRCVTALLLAADQEVGFDRAAQFLEDHVEPASLKESS